MRHMYLYYTQYATAEITDNVQDVVILRGRDDDELTGTGAVVGA